MPAKEQDRGAPFVREAEENGELEARCSQEFTVGGKNYLVTSLEVSGYPIRVHFERNGEQEIEITATWLPKSRQWIFQKLTYMEADIDLPEPRDEILQLPHGTVSNFSRTRWARTAAHEIEIMRSINTLPKLSEQIVRALQILSLESDTNLPAVPRTIHVPRAPRGE